MSRIAKNVKLSKNTTFFKYNVYDIKIFLCKNNIFLICNMFIKIYYYIQQQQKRSLKHRKLSISTLCYRNGLTNLNVVITCIRHDILRKLRK